MDPYSAQIIATTRGADYLRQAEESRVASSARSAKEDAKPAPAPARRPSRSRKASLVQ